MAYKRKFKKGDKITSLDELASQKWIYVFDKITHNGWFMSWQFRMAQSFLQRGNLYYALPNEDMRKEDEGEMTQIGDFVETIHGVNGILTEIKKDGYYGDVAFIATSDMRAFCCPVNDVKGWNDHPTEKGGVKE